MKLTRLKADGLHRGSAYMVIDCDSMEQLDRMVEILNSTYGWKRDWSTVVEEGLKVDSWSTGWFVDTDGGDNSDLVSFKMDYKVAKKLAK